MRTKHSTQKREVYVPLRTEQQILDALAQLDEWDAALDIALSIEDEIDTLLTQLRARSIPSVERPPEVM